MPVEAIHLSAFLDSLRDSRAAHVLSARPLLERARLGALVVDFPYFERFPLGVLRYLLARPLAVSPWGDLFHKQRPIGIGKQLIFTAQKLRRSADMRKASERVLALGLGYLSHAAVDRALHPMVNQLAAQRAERLEELPARQHSEVEKFQSIMFHEERFGFDFMGTRALRTHISVDAHALHQDPALRAAFLFAVENTLRRPLAPELLRAWSRGYTQFVALVSSPAGKWLMPDSLKAEVCAEVFRGPHFDFAPHYQHAVARSCAVLDAALDMYAGGKAEEDAFDALLPEGSIDA